MFTMPMHTEWSTAEMMLKMSRLTKASKAQGELTFMPAGRSRTRIMSSILSILLLRSQSLFRRR